jgi:hypothetical protein
MHLKYIFLIFSLSPIYTIAQILNIEKSVLDKDSLTSFIGNVTGGFTIYNRSAAADNPVEFLGLDFKSNIAYYPGRHRLLSLSNIDYLKINEDVFLNTGYQHFRFDFQKDRKVHPEAFAQYQYDNFRGLSPRLLAGTGMRHRIYKDEQVTFTFSVGIMYESERWEHPVTEESILITFWKSTNYLIFRWNISAWADFNAVQYFQTAYDNEINAFRHRYSTDINLNTKLSERLSWTSSFSLNFENRPIVPIVRTVYKFSNGISVKF